MTNHAPPIQDKKTIIIDTCIFQLMGKSNESRSVVIKDCLTKLATEGYELAISDISLYEHMHGLWGKRATKAYALLVIYKWKAITRKVLFWATYLGGLYHDEKVEGIDMGDKIIAATAVSENGFVLTTNHKDYPHPFFITEKSFALYYQERHYRKTLDVVLYKPNLEILVRKLDEKMQENNAD